MGCLCTSLSLGLTGIDGQHGQGFMGAFPWQPVPGARISSVYSPHANDSFSGREAIAFELGKQITGGCYRKRQWE